MEAPIAGLKRAFGKARLEDVMIDPNLSCMKSAKICNEIPSGKSSPNADGK